MKEKVRTEEVVVVSVSGVDVFGGVDTHRDAHVGAVVDGAGRLLGSESFPADEGGYRRLVAWMGSQGRLIRVGVEGTGSYGAGLARHLSKVGIEVVEVNRPNRRLRRRRGKTDSVDAEPAARAALNGEATSVPESGVGPVECLRMLVVARRSATKARTQAANQIHALVVTAPESVKNQLRGKNLKARVRVCAAFRPGTDHTTTTHAKRALRHLARRYQSLTVEIADLDTEIRRLCTKANPALLAARGVGPHTAAALLIAAGDNPQHMSTEAAFAALCGTSPVPASSGQTIRHRLNRGGNRQANQALWRIAVCRMRCDDRTKQYVPRCRAEGKNRPEDHPLPQTGTTSAHRQRIWRLLTNPPSTPNCARLRRRRQQHGITVARLPKPSEPTQVVSPTSKTAETTTTNSLPDTKPGTTPTHNPNPRQVWYRFDKHRSIFMFPDNPAINDHFKACFRG